MKRALNKNEFLYARRCMQNARSLMEEKLFAQALVELRPAKQLLERDALPTRMAGLLYETEAECHQALGREEKARKAWQAALHTFQAVKDQDKAQHIQEILDGCRPASDPGC